MNFKNQTLTILLAVFVLMSAGCGIVTLPGSTPPTLPFAPPPDGAFPVQIGNLKIEGEPKQADYSTADSKVYNADYVSPQGNQVHYQLDMNADHFKPSDIPTGWELLNTSGATKVYFAATMEMLFIEINDGQKRAKFDVRSIADANEVLKNIPYQALKVAPPASPVVIALPPPPFDTKNSPDKSSSSLDKTLEEVNKSSRDAALALVKVLLKKKYQIESDPKVNKLDPSTLMTNPSTDINSAVQTKLEDSLKDDLGKLLKGLGFRQFVIDSSVVKLN